MKKFSKHDSLTQKRLKELLHYDPKTGIFTRKVKTTNNVNIGDETGYLSYFGYLITAVDNISYPNHRLAWLYMYGYFPENDIDHINKIKTDNRICNLREVSRQCNSRNCGNSNTNTSGVKGVSWCKLKNKWAVYIWIKNKKRALGYYKNFTNAVCARLAGEQCLGWGGCDSNSPAYKYVQEMLKPKKKKLQKIKILKN